VGGRFGVARRQSRLSRMGVAVFRVRRVSANSLDSVCRVVSAVNARTVVLDVQPMILGWRPTTTNHEAGSVVDALRIASPALDALIFASNARHLDLTLGNSDAKSGSLVVRARKPWRIDYLSGVSAPIIVVGDQVVTDGLLAWRMGATFVHWQHVHPTPVWPRVQRMLGSVVARLIFVAEDDTLDDEEVIGS
jgi:hypothetical protein